MLNYRAVHVIRFTLLLNAESSFVRFMRNDKNLFQSVIPDLTRNPVFPWIPAGVYPDEDRGRNDDLGPIEEMKQPGCFRRKRNG